MLFSLMTKVSKWVLLAVFLVVAVGLLAARFSLPGGFSLYSVLTGSMEPALPTGSLIVTRVPAEAGHIQIGDIITFAAGGSGDQLITHRVVETDVTNGSTLFTTRGDANPLPDARQVRFGDIRGVYKGHAPLVGRWLESVKTPIGVLVLIVFPVLLLVGDELRKIAVLLARRSASIVEPTTSDNHWITGSSLMSLSAPFVDSVVANKFVPRKQRTKKIRVVTITFLTLGLTASGVAQTEAVFTSSSITLLSNRMATAEDFSIPSPTPSPSTTPSPHPCREPNITSNSRNTNTGAQSINTNTTTFVHTCDSIAHTTTSTTTEVAIETNTGGNEQGGSTQAGDIVSGSVNVDISISNE